jgi:hypothetical protein
MPDQNVIEASLGADVGPLTLQLRGLHSGLAIDSYASAATLACACWPGDDRAASFAPTVAWSDAANGQVSLTIAGSDTAALGPGDYALELSITASGRTVKRRFGVLRLVATPGDADPPAAYGSLDDMLREAPFLRDLAADADQAGFAEQRGQAREWLDSLLQRHYRGGRALVAMDYSLDHLLWGGARTGADDATLQGYLDDDRLVLTGPSGRRLVRACALYAAAIVCRSQVGATKDDTSYQAHALRLGRTAEAIATGTVASLDTDGDGTADLAIDLGLADRIDQ